MGCTKSCQKAVCPPQGCPQPSCAAHRLTAILAWQRASQTALQAHIDRKHAEADRLQAQLDKLAQEAHLARLDAERQIAEEEAAETWTFEEIMRNEG